MEANVTEDGRLLLDGTRIIMQILVDEFVNKLTKETKDEIQKWYDRCYNIETGNSSAPACARKKVGSRLVAIQGVWSSAEEYLGPRSAAPSAVAGGRVKDVQIRGAACQPFSTNSNVEAGKSLQSAGSAQPNRGLTTP